MTSFVKWKFNRMLAVATVVMAVNYVVMLSGSVIVGRLVGPDGLAGLNVCTPAFGAASFLAALLSVGSALVFSRAMGAFDARRAAGVFSQTMLLALVMGAAIYAVMGLGADFFFDRVGVTGAVRLQAAHYWRWQAVAMALLPAVLTMEALVYADGDGAVATLAGALHVSGAIGLSVLFTRRMGDAGGVAAGTALTMAVVLAVCCLHFCRRANHLKPCLWFSWKALGETCAASLADSTIYLCWGLLVLVVNRFTVVHYGQHLLSVVALTASVVEFSIVFDGVGEALIPLGGMYEGEGNRPALRTLANHSALVATLEGVVCGALFFGLAPTLAAWYGFDPASFKLYDSAVFAIRTLALVMPFMGLLMMMNTHYLVVRHIPFAVSVTVMKDFVFPCAGVIALGRPGSHWGEWMWVGFAAGYVVAVAYPFLFVLIRYGRGLFPWLIERDEGKSVDFTVCLSEPSLTEAVERISGFLNDRGIFGPVVGKVAAVVAETGRLTAKAGRGRVRAEYFVDCAETGTVRLVVRDTGREADVRSAADSVREASESRYLSTLGCNRAEYVFR